VSELPKGWALASLGELLQNIETGKSFKCEERPPMHDEVGVVKVSAVTWGRYQELESKTCIDPERVNPALFIAAGDFLFSRANTIDLVGACVIAENVGRHVMLSDKILRFRFTDESHKYWVLNLLRSKAGRQQIEALASGNQDSMRNIGQEKIQQIEIPLPPSAEQTRIIAKLEELLEGLDAGVAELKAAQKKLAQYRQSLLKAAVAGELTAEWRQHNRPTETAAQLLERILTERRTRWEARQLAKFKEQGKAPPKDWQQKYPEPVQPDTADLPELPEGWVWARIEQTGEVQLGRQRAPQFHTGPNMVPYLRVANVFEEHIDVSDVMEMHFSEEDEAAFKLAPGDILLNEGQSLEWVGRPAIFRGELQRACFTNTLVRFRPENGVLAEYALAVFLHYMHSGKFRKIAKITTNIAHLGAGRFAELEFPLPSVEEQIEVVRVLRDLTDEAHRQAAAIALALKRSTAQRQNLLRAAFSGQLVPQAPDNEPARVLLERIRAERAAQEITKTLYKKGKNSR